MSDQEMAFSDENIARLKPSLGMTRSKAQLPDIVSVLPKILGRAASLGHYGRV